MEDRDIFRYGCFFVFLSFSPPSKREMSFYKLNYTTLESLFTNRSSLFSPSTDTCGNTHRARFWEPNSYQTNVALTHMALKCRLGQWGGGRGGIKM